MQGKEKLLTAYPVSFYAHTSGTLGAAKHIPYTEKAEEIVHRYASIAREAYEETLSGKLPHMPSEPKMLYLATAREDVKTVDDFDDLLKVINDPSLTEFQYKVDGDNWNVLIK